MEVITMVTTMDMETIQMDPYQEVNFLTELQEVPPVLYLLSRTWIPLHQILFTQQVPDTQLLELMDRKELYLYHQLDQMVLTCIH